MTIEALAKEMGATVEDTKAFVAGLSVWTRKGYSVEQAIEKHMQQMYRIANNATNPLMKDVVVEIFFPN
jgi:hypothetical protein